MKILFLTRRFWPEIGGVEKHVLEVGKQLVKLGHEVEVVAEENKILKQVQDDNQARDEMGNTDSIKIYRIPITKNEKLK